MRRLIATCVLLGLGGNALLASEAVRTTDWVDFREATLRVVLEGPVPDNGPLRGGLEIRMMPGFKTYWRNAGDSGVPPVATPMPPGGLAKITLAFPFPKRFDDGAGGTAYGYTDHVILPLTMLRNAGPASFRFDFAVCGTMCIPLSTDFVIDPARLKPGLPADLQAIEAFRAKVPTVLAGDAARAALRIERQMEEGKPLWKLHLLKTQPAPGMSVFPDGQGYLEIKEAGMDAAGHPVFVMTGDPPAGKGGQFGEARLIFGDERKSFEVRVDLDSGQVLP